MSNKTEPMNPLEEDEEILLAESLLAKETARATRKELNRRLSFRAGYETPAERTSNPVERTIPYSHSVDKTTERKLQEDKLKTSRRRETG